METYQTYKGYGIRYFIGVTTVEYNGVELRNFINMGEITGRLEAIKYIDSKI